MCLARPELLISWERSCESGLLGSISWGWVRTMDALLPLLSALLILLPAPRSPGCCLNEPRKLCLRAFALVISYASFTFSPAIHLALCLTSFSLCSNLTFMEPPSPALSSSCLWPCSISSFFYYQDYLLAYQIILIMMRILLYVSFLRMWTPHRQGSLPNSSFDVSLVPI